MNLRALTWPIAAAPDSTALRPKPTGHGQRMAAHNRAMGAARTRATSATVLRAVQDGHSSLHQIATAAGMSAVHARRHLRALRDAGIVRRIGAGRRISYVLATERRGDADGAAA